MPNPGKSYLMETIDRGCYSNPLICNNTLDGVNVIYFHSIPHLYQTNPIGKECKVLQTILTEMRLIASSLADGISTVRWTLANCDTK